MHRARFRAETGDHAGSVAAFEEALPLPGDMPGLRIGPLIGLCAAHVATGDAAAADGVRVEALSLLETARCPGLRAVPG